MSISFETRRYVVFSILSLLGLLYATILLRGGLRQSSSSGTPISAQLGSTIRRENATLVILARNSDLKGVISSMRNLESRFNHRYQYPWVFLNDEEFTNEFKGLVLLETNAPVHFGLIPKEQWVQPAWIDEGKAEESRHRLKEQNIIYGDSSSYRNMCRFNSGYFFHHPLLQQFKFYWRVEPDVKYFCDMSYDPFQYMIQNNQTYGFTITLLETPETVTTLWDSVKEFMTKYPQYIANDNALEFISSDGGKTYNMCHFWSNFEIADMDFWRSDAYQTFFEFLDAKGGFYYERWGDAPVHSIAAALFLPKHRLHFFQDIGYQHASYQHCPSSDESLGNSCSCHRWNTIDYRKQSCLPQYNAMLLNKATPIVNDLSPW
ncbi:glycosyltransferase family 15 protein [Lentinula aff. detonsa]|uniref:Glycosyltransferase family 15 protein n=1 Tax=Lentinula aff. detonsa TaxID=2804958 RepID=A0AA38KDS2_9AGAR|nr:glycosyltransferase family 15 protein [Lentinula aff. detonsa]